MITSYTQPLFDQIWLKYDIWANLNQKCLILCSKILLNVLHNLSRTVLLPWQHTGFQASPIFTPLVFTTTGGMSDECQRYHSHLAELLAVKKQENFASTITGLGLESHFPFWGLHWFACEARVLRGELLQIYRDWSRTRSFGRM